MSTARDYPLKWPEDWPRTLATQRRSAPYKTSLDSAVSELLADLRRMGARDVTLSSQVRSSLGVKISESEVKDPGVAVYWTDKKGMPRVMACDHWHRLRDNVRAVGLTIASLRQIDRCGATGMLDRALNGFVALPEAPDCWRVLGVSRGAHKEVLSERFRELSRQHHPDRGGDARHYAEITQAYHEALGATP